MTANSWQDDKPLATTTEVSNPSRNHLCSDLTSRESWSPFNHTNSGTAGVTQPRTSNSNSNSNNALLNGPITGQTAASAQKGPILAKTHAAITHNEAQVRVPSSVHNGLFAKALGPTNNESSPLPPSDLRGSASAQRDASPAGQTRPQPIHIGFPTGLATQGNSGTPSNGHNPLALNKPVLKMKRTGQNFPLSSVAVPHQRNGSNGFKSPSRNASLSADSLRKPPDSLPTKVGAAPSKIRETPVPVPKPHLRPVAQNSVAGPSVHGTASKSFTVPDSESDDIIYETAGQTGLDGSEMAVNGDVVEDASSSDDSDSQSDEDDETIEDGNMALTQLFQAPDQEDDYDDDNSSGNGSDDDDAISVPSSDDYSIANEVAVALPSANVQRHVAYPTKTLEEAEPGRLYSEFRDGDRTIKAGPAMFPVGYRKSTAISGFPWVCAVRSCSLLYKTPAGLSNHARFTHKKTMLNDNMDGTLSLAGSYTDKNPSGHFPPVVVSRRPLDPDEPPMRKPSIKSSYQSGPKKKTVKAAAEHAIPGPDGIVMGDGELGSLESSEAPPRPQTADRENSEQMWEYILPFLTVHKSPPVKNWARHIMHLPRVRKVEWNEERIKDFPYKDSHPRDVTALIIQATGVRSLKPCNLCAKGRGPFIGCIVISPEASDAVQASVLSCANCYYHCGQSSCSICKEVIARRPRARVDEKLDDHNVKPFSDVAQGKLGAASKHPQANSSLATFPLEPSARRSLKLYQPSEFTVIEKASMDRTYKVIKAKDGGDASMCGALIPEKYDLDHTIAGYPWICPVRSCRKVFKKIVSIGSHFVKAHPGALLNDNLDGTLSQIGLYKEPRPGANGFPALIISQKPLDPKEPPMPEPSRPAYAKVDLTTKQKSVITKVPVVKEPWQPVGEAKKLWNYMLPYLPNDPSSVTSSPEILALLYSPRQRDMQWRSRSKGRSEDDSRQIIALIIYLTGQEVKGGTKQCTHCDKGHGPFPHCIALRKGVLGMSRSTALVSCANCVYMHKANECSIKSWNLDPIASEPTFAFASHKRQRITDSESEEPLAIRRRSDRFGIVEDGPTRPENGRRLDVNRDGRLPRSGLEQLPAIGAGNGGSLLKNEASLSSALIDAGHIQSDDLLEMEDWEITPGRIRTTGAGAPDSIAFSKSYLETNQPMRISRDVTFEVKAIKAGNRFEISVDRGKTGYCSLASGKLHVTIAEHEPFVIGQHGVFKIMPGLTARLQNKLYIDSVVHISTYAEG